MQNRDLASRARELSSDLMEETRATVSDALKCSTPWAMKLCLRQVMKNLALAEALEQYANNSSKHE